MRTAPEFDEDKDKETGVTFSELKLLQVRNVREAITKAVAENDDELDITVMGLIISLLVQDTS